MNIFQLISTIDGILDRLVAVAPQWDARHGGPTQWLFLHEIQDSFESELSRSATTLSVPVFPDPRDPDEEWEETFPLTLSGTPLPKASPSQEAFSVDFRLIQIMSGVRAVLLVLVDSAALTCHRPSGESDPDYIGNLPSSNVLSAIIIMSTWTEENFVPNAKYWKDWPLARFLENPLPPCPPSWGLSPEDPLFSGDLRRYVTRASRFPWQHKQSPAFFRLVFGLSQSKRGFATVPRSFVRAALVKHRSKLSTPPKGSPDLESVRKFARVLLRGFRAPSIVDSLMTIEASTRASNDVSRLEGGGREDLRHQLIAAFGSQMIQGSISNPLVIKGHSNALVRIVDLGGNRSVEERGFLPPSRTEWRNFLSRPINDWSHIPLAVEEREVEYKGTKKKILDSIEKRKKRKAKKAAQQPPLEFRSYPRAKVAEVLEPLKVRLITAMNALRTFIARPLQGALWRHLRSFPPFQLIGEEISTMAIRALIERHEALFGLESSPEDLLDFVSGDYSAATDGLDIRVSKVILEVILECLQEDDLDLAPFMRGVLLEQVLEYPRWSKLDPVLQCNGQLMGSVLSFPILCISNLYTYVLSLPEKLREGVLQGTLPIRDLPVLVNGDDILFRADDAHYQRWLASIDTVGFVPSVGKNFRHKRFFTVNSVPIEYIPDFRQDDFFWFLRLGKSVNWYEMEQLEAPLKVHRLDTVLIHGFLNVGLLTGQAKLTGRESLGALPLSGWHAGSVLLAANPALAHRRFLHYHRSEIRKQTFFGKMVLNLFAHPLLGGLGFRIPPGIEPRYSEAQRVLARQLFLSASTIYEGQSKDYPLSSFLYLDATEKSLGTILGHRRDRVEIEMFPIGTPLPQGYQNFEDVSALHLTPLASAMDSGTSPMQASCRLSDSQLNRLIRGSFRNEKSLHPIDEMNVFPFLPVRVRREIVDPKGIVVPILPVYHPPNYFSDHVIVPVPGPKDEASIQVLSVDDPNVILLIPHLGPSEALPELWELPNLSSSLQEEIRRGFHLRNLSTVIREEERKEVVRRRRKEQLRFYRDFLGRRVLFIDENEEY